MTRKMIQAQGCDYDAVCELQKRIRFMEFNKLLTPCNLDKIMFNHSNKQHLMTAVGHHLISCNLHKTTFNQQPY